jgi:hypothetical protein
MVGNGDALAAARGSSCLYVRFNVIKDSCFASSVLLLDFKGPGHKGDRQVTAAGVVDGDTPT